MQQTLKQLVWTQREITCVCLTSCFWWCSFINDQRPCWIFCLSDPLCSLFVSFRLFGSRVFRLWHDVCLWALRASGCSCQAEASDFSVNVLLFVAVYTCSLSFAEFMLGCSVPWNFCLLLRTEWPRTEHRFALFIHLCLQKPNGISLVLDCHADCS